MALPLFGPSEDPGPDFSALLTREGMTGLASEGIAAELPHGTTVLAIRFDGGVIMAGDRRATAGN